MIVVPLIETQTHLKIDLNGWKKIESLTEYALVESLDHVSRIKDITDDFNVPDGLHNFRVHETEDGDNLISFEKDGAVEIHHANKDGVSGKILTGENNNKGPNSRFVSNMFHLGTEFLHAGKNVRIVAPDNMINKYHRIANIVKNTHKFDIGSIEHSHFEKDNVGNTVEHKKFIISPTVVSEAIIVLNNFLR